VPRFSALEAERTRGRILDETVQLMSVHGAAGTSLAAVADQLGMSKAGVVGPFHSRDALLLEAFDLGVEKFRERVVAPALHLSLRPGTERLQVLVESWIDYLVDSPFRGGCLLTSASCEQDGGTGALRDHTVEAIRQWRSFLEAQLAEAATAGHALRLDASDTAVTLIGMSMGLNQAVQLADPATAARSARLMRDTAGLV
jgi:AcrR family transcriptional regulator